MMKSKINTNRDTWNLKTSQNQSRFYRMPQPFVIVIGYNQSR